jgi:hypothetical protein
MNINVTPFGRSASDEDLAAFEKEVGYKLPRPYQSFLREYNGGTPQSNVFCVAGKPLSGVRRFFGLSDDQSHSLRQRLKDPIILSGRIPSDFLPVADDSCGNRILLCLGSDDYGAVYFWDHELETLVLQDGGEKDLIRVANDWTEFLNLLTELVLPERVTGRVVRMNQAFMEKQRRKGNMR